MILPTFASKKELFAHLIANKSEILDMKKSAIKHADPIAFSGIRGSVSKAAGASDDTADTINRDVIGNTYLWMDSHKDVHLPNVFGKSIKDRGVSKIWHLHDHEFAIAAKVGKPVSIEEKYVDWQDLQVSRKGQTQVLMMNTNIQRKLNDTIFDAYKDGEIDQHSVSMVYVQLALAIDDKEYKDEYAIWKQWIDQLGNKAEAEKEGFFWAVAEAKLIEISCVLEGSNTLTPTWGKSTENEPDLSTQTQPNKSQVSISNILKHI